MIRQTLAHLPSLSRAPALLSPLAAATQTGAGVLREAQHRPTGLRWLSDQPSLELPLSWLEGPTPAAGLMGLRKLGEPPQAAQPADKTTLAFTTARLNRTLAGAPQAPWRHFGLTSGQALGVAQTVLQAHHALQEPPEEVTTLSLMYQLLSGIPVPPQLLGRFSEFASQLVQQAVGPLRVFDASHDWFQRSAQDRADIVRGVFSSARLLMPLTGVSVASLQDVHLQLKPAASSGESSVFAGSFCTQNSSINSRETCGIVTLDRGLVDLDADTFARDYPTAACEGDLGGAMVLSLIAHELWHGAQHLLLDQLPLGPKAGAASSDALCLALSIGTQSEIQRQHLPVHDGPHKLLVHLPHEQQAWAKTFLIMRALLKDPQVPDRVKAGVKAYMMRQADSFAPLFPGGQLLRPRSADGVLWQDGQLCVRMPSEKKSGAATPAAS